MLDCGLEDSSGLGGGLVRRNIPLIQRFISSSSLNMAMDLHRDETTKKAMAVAATRFTADVMIRSGSRSRGQESRQKRGSASRR